MRLVAAYVPRALAHSQVQPQTQTHHITSLRLPILSRRMSKPLGFDLHFLRSFDRIALCFRSRVRFTVNTVGLLLRLLLDALNL